MRRLSLCDEQGALFYEANFRDAARVLTSMGEIGVTTLRGSTKASRTILGAPSGGCLYTSKYGGAYGNQIIVAHIHGPNGAGHANRVCEITVVGKHITIIFGTNGAGVTAAPMGNQVAALVRTTPAAAALVNITAGVGSAGLAGAEALTGGRDDGDLLKFLGCPPVLRRINDVEVV
jgi:hypothetical protein